jgi:hypothetical protein
VKRDENKFSGVRGKKASVGDVEGGKKREKGWKITCTDIFNDN